ncbi:hypothetical protein VPNG_00084 [Cytospora leucostoma]|uniref:Uncharacterized protein n=1 Tax=Cytospora leucostoma TaxID=1230097 RepID=A0A423XPG8_9PEZI|nr:hypothetical protein VPNG_00084 [Cytospora leucostoma]
MVPASALRETVVLIIFGIVLVPIAAKRAQDAPGYWQTFSTSRAGQQALAYGVDDLPWSSRLARMVNETLTYAIPAAAAVAEGSAKPNETIPMYASGATQAETRSPSPMTIRFRVARAAEGSDATTTIMTTPTGSSDNMAMATVTPSVLLQKTGVSGGSSIATPTVTETSAASKERWTLIWMGAAIAAVALFMSFC